MEYIREYLRKGEEVQWQGRTGELRLLEEDVKGLIIGKWIGTLAAFAAVLLLYLYSMPWNAGIVVVILAAEIYFLLTPVLEWKGLQGQQYWITDQRAILMTGDHIFHGMELRDIDAFCTMQRQDGKACLLLGSSILNGAGGQLRWYACHPKMEQQQGEASSRITGMVFYEIENAEGAAGYLRERIGKSAA